MKQLKLTNTPLIDNVDRLPVNHNQYERDQLKAELNDRNKQYLSLQTTIAFVAMTMLVVTGGYMLATQNLNLFTFITFVTWLGLFLVGSEIKD